MNKFEKEENNKSLMSKNLISTVKSIDRTFLSQIRTAAIFSGLSVLLINKKFINESKIILFLSIIILISLIYVYNLNLKYVLDNNSSSFFYNEFYFNVSFGVLLVFIQFILIISLIY